MRTKLCSLCLVLAMGLVTLTGPPRNRSGRDHPADGAGDSDGHKYCRRAPDDRRQSLTAK